MPRRGRYFRILGISKVGNCCGGLAVSVYSEVGHSASGMRPGNPTPAHAAGQGSPAPVRPSAPTPAHAQKIGPGRPGKGCIQGNGLVSTYFVLDIIFNSPIYICITKM